jgi:hypothetical protein
MRWPFTPFGTSTLLACLAGLAGLSAVIWLATGSAWAAAAPSPLALFVLNFFRDPERGVVHLESAAPRAARPTSSPPPTAS